MTTATKTDRARALLSVNVHPKIVAQMCGISASRAYVIKWRMENPEAHRDFMRRWRKDFPDKARAQIQKDYQSRLAKKTSGNNRA